MPDIHVSLLALHDPELCFGLGAARLVMRPRRRGCIWSTLLFAIGIVDRVHLASGSRSSAEPATWAQTILGAMFVWAMMALGYGIIPHEWLTFGELVPQLRHGDVPHAARTAFIPFDITATSVVDVGRGGDLRHRARAQRLAVRRAWQKRTVAEPVAEGDDGRGRRRRPAAVRSRACPPPREARRPRTAAP